MAEQLFCLKWNEHTATLISTFRRMLDNQLFVDVTLACEGRYIKAHRLILSSCSKYLDELLRDNHGQHPIIILPDIKYDDIKVLIDYIYGGEVYISFNQLPSLLKAAEVLRIKGLTDAIDDSHGSNRSQNSVERSNSSSSADSCNNAGSSANSNHNNVIAVSLPQTSSLMGSKSNELSLTKSTRYTKGGRQYSGSAQSLPVAFNMSNLIDPSMQQQLAILLANNGSTNLDNSIEQSNYFKQPNDESCELESHPTNKKRKLLPGLNGPKDIYDDRLKLRADQRKRISRDINAQQQQQQQPYFEDDDGRLATRVMNILAANRRLDKSMLNVNPATDVTRSTQEEGGNSRSSENSCQNMNGQSNARISRDVGNEEDEDDEDVDEEQQDGTANMEQDIHDDNDDNSDLELPMNAPNTMRNKSLIENLIDADEVYANNGNTNYQAGWKDEDYDDAGLLAETSYDDCYAEDGKSLVEEQDVNGGDREKTFVCHLCRLTFTAQSSLRRHMSRHYTDRERFECEICHNSYSRKDYLKEHIKTKHPS
ncbi:Longitudinals lacking protein, isoform G, partial [Fragariocoptes setiger]